MVNQIGNASDVKVDKAIKLSSPQMGKDTTRQEGSQQKVSDGERQPILANEGGDAQGVSVVINGKEQQLRNNKDAKEEIKPEDAKKMSEALNEFMDKLNCDIQFKYNDKLDFMTIKMINKKTKEVIREFPPDELLKTMEKTQEWIGIFLDKKA